MIALAALALATAEPPPGLPAQPPPAGQSAGALGNAGGTVQVMADFGVAQAQRGPLEGRWRIVGRRGAPIYLIQLADPGGRADARATAPATPAIEGAWCDPKRAESPQGCGYLAAAKRVGPRLTLLFFEDGGERTAELAADRRGRWRGEIFDAGRRTAVVMARDPLFAAVAASGG
ncbi:MAG TPA: hypothetical protein VN805_06100 [Caulobacteraceae bacterium]|nr:hypothetical protein [Caulobacteraceae bacterium]